MQESLDAPEYVEAADPQWRPAGGEAAPVRHALVFPASELAALRQMLLAQSPLETACFLLARAVSTPAGGWRLVVYDSIILTEDDYTVRSDVAIELPPAVVARVMQRGRADGASIVIAHSHPRAEIVRPSDRDIAGEALLLPAFDRRIPNVPHARLIVGPSALHATLLDTNGSACTLEVVGVGADIAISLGDGTPKSDTGAADPLVRRYDRQVRAFGEPGQHQLASLRVAIVGLGGTGSVTAQQLAHLGVGSFILIDRDTIEETNLNRVVGARPTDVGRAKVDVARDMILGINPGAVVDCLCADVRDRATVRRVLDADVFLLCTDSQGSRAVLTQVAYQYLLPGFDVGVAIHSEGDRISHISGRVQMLAPKLPCLLCSEVLDPEAVRRDLLTEDARAQDRYIVGAAIPQPAVVSINSAASSLAVTMLLSAITGIPYATRNQRLRLESGIVSRVELEPRDDCPVCSTRGALARGDSWPTPGRA